jgi:GT2 family glycosyltransferase
MARGRELFTNLPKRVYLTIKYEGAWGFIRKAARFPLRLTPLGRYLVDEAGLRDVRSRAKRWYRSEGRPVTIIIPAYGDPEPTIEAVKGVRRTTRRRAVRIIVADDGSPPEARDRLRKDVHAELVMNSENAGYASNVNSALRRVFEDDTGDVVLLNNDVVARRDWLETLQYVAYESEDRGIIGPRLLYPDGRIQSAGSYRNLDQPRWFDHRFRFKGSDHGPANIPAPVLGVTGACIYITREALSAVGLLDEEFGMAFEDMDYCLRVWEKGFRVFYHPASQLLHCESQSRGQVQGERELGSQRHFWAKWGDWFDSRDVSSGSRLRIVYVTEDTGIGGGHRDIFEHLNRLAARGHEVALYTLGGQPDWFDLQVPVRSFEDYDDLIDALSPLEAIKVATWWLTSEPVWLASVTRGIPVYFVQDIETSYYPDDQRLQDAVLKSYRQEFRYMTISSFNQQGLRELGVEAELIPPGLDLGTYRELGVERRDDVLLAIGRSHHLKNLDLTVAAWRAMPEPRPELWLFGIEPQLGEKYGARYFTSPSDEEVNDLFNRATVFVQTSRHEGFCLPALEAMAAGTAVVSTDAHGNRDFCFHQRNCLVPEATEEAVSDSLARLFRDPALRRSLAEEARATSVSYAWERRIDRLEAFFNGLSGRRRPEPEEADARSTTRT